MVLHGNLSFLDKVIKATNFDICRSDVLFLRIIGVQISNIPVSFNKLKEWIFERYEKISLSNEMLQTNVHQP